MLVYNHSHTAPVSNKLLYMATTIEWTRLQQTDSANKMEGGKEEWGKLGEYIWLN